MLCDRIAPVCATTGCVKTPARKHFSASRVGALFHQGCGQVTTRGWHAINYSGGSAKVAELNADAIFRGGHDCRGQRILVHYATKNSAACVDVSVGELNFTSSTVALNPFNLPGSHFTLLHPDRDRSTRDGFPHT
jgi:hypothetical protein